jgi:hypothetical protein
LAGVIETAIGLASGLPLAARGVQQLADSS